MELTDKQILASDDEVLIRELLEKRYPGGMNLVRKQLELIGEKNTTRQGLVDTPYRVVKSWLEIYSGYNEDESMLDVMFDEGLDLRDDEMVLCEPIQFHSTCEHHLIPFHGSVYIGYIPGKRVIGLSKLARVVEFYSRRVQIQEKMGQQIADKLVDIIKPHGVGVIIVGNHMCMRSRGVKNSTAKMKTFAKRGTFRINDVKNEFLHLIQIDK